MSAKNKNHNRIIFLTTLSVYLGLVLVGGTAPVLAHSALTRNFDIRNEIEVTDDLDKKPDNEEVEIVAQEDFPALFAQLLNEIKQGIESGKIASPIQTNFRFEAFFNSSERCSTSAFGFEPSSDKYLAKIVSDSFSQKFGANALESADYPRASAKRVKLNLQAADADFSLKISFGKSNAAQFAAFLNQKYASFSPESDLEKQAYENTTVSSENNQVFIVTRLPRAAIDEFLATSAR